MLPGKRFLLHPGEKAILGARLPVRGFRDAWPLCRLEENKRGTAEDVVAASRPRILVTDNDLKNFATLGLSFLPKLGEFCSCCSYHFCLILPAAFPQHGNGDLSHHLMDTHNYSRNPACSSGHGHYAPNFTGNHFPGWNTTNWQWQWKP